MLKKQRMIVLILILFVLLTISCDRTGKVNSNEKPVVRITSLGGYSDANSPDTTANVFKQRIEFYGYDTDGVVEGFAYRVWDDSTNTYRVTPGHEIISDEGWIMHYEEGANEDIPLSSDNAMKTIWNKRPYAIINFPAENEIGYNEADSVKIYMGRYTFEIMCIDNRGETSDIVSRKFDVESFAHKIVISTTTGSIIAGSDIGMGMTLQFSMPSPDVPYVNDRPYYYQYKIQKVNDVTDVVEYDTDFFYSTQNNANKSLAQVLENDVMYSPEVPFYTPDYNEYGQTVTYTRIIANVVDEAMIVSEPDTVEFYAKRGFHPGTLIYFEDCLFYSDYHFATQQMKYIPRVVDPIVTSEGIRYPIPLYTDFEGKINAVTSDGQLKGTLHFGYHGEYQADNPFTGKLENFVLDEESGKNYHTEITHFDIRVDGAPFEFQGLPADQNNVTDDDGKEWLRVPISHQIAQNPVVSSLSLGKHVVEVRARDLQGIVDPTPAVLEFYAVEPPAKIEDSVLLLNTYVTYNNNILNSLVESVYQQAVTSFTNVDYVLLSELNYPSYWDTDLAYSKTVKIAPSDLMKYELVVYISDNIKESSYEYDNISLYSYCHFGGNLVISGGKNLVIVDLGNQGYFCPGFSNKMGFNLFDELKIYSEDFTAPATTSDKTYFEYARSNNANYPDLYVNLSANLLLPNMQGMGPISYIEPEALVDSEPILYFGCREIGDGPGDPSLAEKEYWESKVVGNKKVTNGSKVFTFTFPLTLMKADEVKSLFDSIREDIQQ